MDTVIPIGTKIKFYRKRKGLAQNEVAKKLGIQPATYCKYENNVHRPKEEMIERISSILGINSKELYDDYLFSYLNNIGIEIDENYEIIASISPVFIDNIQKILKLFNYSAIHYPNEQVNDWMLSISNGDFSLELDSESVRQLHLDLERAIKLLLLEQIHNQSNDKKDH